jgi:hypothetical protein
MKRFTRHALFILVLVFAARSASATPFELITNGDFEAGTFAGWSVVHQAGSFGGWYIGVPGDPSPLIGLPTSASGGNAHGNYYALTDSDGPGAHVLIQGFNILPGMQSVLLSFDLFANDYSGGPFFGGQGLDYSGDPNQFVRVDLLAGTAGAFDMGTLVLSNVYNGVDNGFNNPNPFTHFSLDITSLVSAGGNFQIRFSQVDNQFFFNTGVDNVSVAATAVTDVPEPATVLSLLMGLAIMAWRAHLQQPSQEGA